MRQELTCITCPIGCRLVVERPSAAAPDGAAAGDAVAELVVSGNRCPRGAAYAREELLAPKRTVTATCRAVTSNSSCTSGGSRERRDSRSGETVRRIPCRTTAPFPRERVDELLLEIYALEQVLPVTRGQVLLRDALGLGINVIATRTLGVE